MMLGDEFSSLHSGRFDPLFQKQPLWIQTLRVHKNVAYVPFHAHQKGDVCGKCMVHHTNVMTGMFPELLLLWQHLEVMLFPLGEGAGVYPG